MMGSDIDGCLCRNVYALFGTLGSQKNTRWLLRRFHQLALWVMAKAAAEVTGNKVEITIQPFANHWRRSREKNFDFHLPFIQEQTARTLERSLIIDSSHYFANLSSSRTNRRKWISTNWKTTRLKRRGHVRLLTFRSLPSASLEGSLKKVDTGAIDGFIFSEASTDKVSKSVRFEKHQERVYKRYEQRPFCPRGNGNADKLFRKQWKIKPRAVWKIMGTFERSIR